MVFRHRLVSSFTLVSAFFLVSCNGPQPGASSVSVSDARGEIDAQDQTAEAAGLVSETIDRLFSPYTKEGGPGAMVAVLKGDKLLHLKGYGYANREFKAPWTADTPYTFYSTTKPMVAIALMRLEDEGRIDLDAPVRTYLTDFPAFPINPTVRHLLQHTAGVWQDERLHFLVGAGAAYEELTMDELYHMVIKQPALSFSPGSTYHYNDAALRIAGRVLRTVTDKSFEDALRDLVFDPAGMESTVHRPRSTGYRPGQASTYLLSMTPDADVSVDELHIPALEVETAGDGGLLGTMQDYIAFARFASKSRSGGSYVKRLAEPVVYGPGVIGGYRTSWWVERHRGFEIYRHSGLFGKTIAYVPELDAWILIMANAIGGKHGDRHSYFEILDALLHTEENYTEQLASDAEERYGLNNVPPAQDFSLAEREALIGTFVDAIDGNVLTIREEGNQLSYSYLFGPEGYLVREGDGIASWRYDRTEPVKLRVDDNTLEAHISDWNGFRSMTRVAPADRLHEADVEKLIGTYYSRTYGSIYHVEKRSSGLVLRVNAGVRRSDTYALTPVTSGVFRAEQQDDGRVFGLLRFQLSITSTTDEKSYLTIDAHNLRGFELAPTLQ
ncbi:MAG: serine hydrolase domain-containing protein [Pseudomonadota bacterium]